MKTIWCKVDSDCYKSKRFMHAFLSYPSYEEIHGIVKVAPEEYADACSEKWTTTTPYPLEEQ